MEVLAFLIFMLLIILAPFFFVGWVIYSVVRAIAGGVTHGARTMTHAATGIALPGHTVRCPTDGCKAVNPADARFCRRCGHGLPAAHRVQVRRAAVW
jgi:hypothetical protein